MIIKDPGKRHIGWFDVHIPKPNPLKGAYDYLHDKGADHVILGGDILDMQFASHWNDRMFKAIGTIKQKEMIDEELDAGRRFLKSVRKAAGKKAKIWWVLGNHESWLLYVCFYHGLYSLPIKSKDVHFRTDIAAMMDTCLGDLYSRLTGAKDFNIHVLNYNEPLKIGHIIYLHGHQFGAGGGKPTRASLLKYPGQNLVFGHHHTEDRGTGFNQGDPKQVVQHYAVPGLTGLAPGYLKDKSTRWLNGFWDAQFSKDGLFDGQVIKVFDGKVIRS